MTPISLIIYLNFHFLEVIRTSVTKDLCPCDLFSDICDLNCCCDKVSFNIKSIYNPLYKMYI